MFDIVKYEYDNNNNCSTDDESTIYESGTEYESSSDSDSRYRSESSECVIKKYNMVLCEIFNPVVHGMDNESDPAIQGHLLVNTKFNIINWREINNIKQEYKNYMNSRIISNNKLNKHPLIRNYKNIISTPNYIKPEIAEVIYLQGNECVAILKTFWIRIFLRICKKKIHNVII